MLENNLNVYRAALISRQPYSIPFIFWKASDLQVWVTKDGVDTLLDSSEYTITGSLVNTGEDIASSDSTISDDDLVITDEKVTLTEGAYQEYADYDAITFMRVVEPVQDIDYTNGTNVNAEVIERSLDKLTAITQQHEESLKRTLRFSVSEEGSNVTLPDSTSRANSMLGFGPDGNSAVVRSIAQFDTDVANTALNASSASSSANAATAQALKAEGYAVGEQNGVEVGSGSPYYENNAKHYSDVAKTAADLVETHATELETVSENISDIGTVAGIASDVSAVASIDEEITAIAPHVSDIVSVADDITDIVSVAGDLTNIDAVAGDLTNIDAVAENQTNVDAVASDLTNINSVAADLQNIDNASVEALKSEGYAVGKQNGVDVGSGSVYYENNAKYYASRIGEIVNHLYPIGAVYISKSSTSPASLFGGTWSQIKDKFLMTMGDTYTTSGGSATATLVEANLPSHSHGFTPGGSVSVAVNPTFSGNTMSGTVSNMMSCSGGATASGVFTINSNEGTWPSARNELSRKTSFSLSARPSGSISGGSYSFSGTAGTTDATGSGDPISILPPFDVVYAWERIA